MGRDHRDVLGMVEVPRKPGDVSFLMNQSRLTAGVVEQRLRELEVAGLVRSLPNGFWDQTQAGRTQLRAVEQWEIYVEDVFQITSRGQIATGSLRRGVAHLDDWFRTSDGSLGRISSIEFPHNVASEDSIAFSADVELRPGLVLLAETPMAG